MPFECCKQGGHLFKLMGHNRERCIHVNFSRIPEKSHQSFVTKY